MAPDDLKFEVLKEHCGWYFVEYRPPLPTFPFSILQLSVLEPRDAKIIAEAMEAEAVKWLRRYPIAVMVTAFTLSEDVVQLKGVRNEDSLIAWQEGPEKSPIIRWEMVPDEALPKDALDKENIKAIFADIPYKTGEQIRKAVEKEYAGRKAGFRIIFVWAVIVPLAVAVLEWWSDLLGLVVLVYAFIKAGIEALRYWGRLPKSARQLEKEREEARMRHHHYHCLRNPAGFERLKLENYEKELVEKTTAQAEALKSKIA